MKTIPLTKGKVALVDDEDYEQLIRHKWHAIQPHPNGTFYAARRDGERGWRYTYMHNALVGEVGVDHRNNNGLDNQRANIRKATAQQNGMNQRLQSRKARGFKGVIRASKASRMDHKWMAYITRDGRRQYLGYFDSPKAAAQAYDGKAVELFGEFAKTNAAMGLL